MQRMRYQRAVLRIRITFMRIRILIVTLMRIRILPYTFMQIRILASNESPKP
jgi:hypothetical protein